jgi:hypothetical protein
MAKTLRTSGDYTIKAGAGSAGTNDINLDSRLVRVKGNLVVDGVQTTVNSTTIQIDDPIFILARNNSGTDIDSGIMINRGGQTGAGNLANNNVAFYWDEGDNVFKAALTTSDGSGVAITETELVKIRVAEPAANSDAATKNYVDSSISGVGSMDSFNIVGDDSTGVTITDGEYLQITGGNNISVVVAEPFSWSTVTINLNQNLNNINSISNGTTNGNLVLSANGTGSVIVNNILTFNSNASTPTATAITKLYSKTPGYGDTGVYFVNSAVKSGAEQELISKRKATVLAIALG